MTDRNFRSLSLSLSPSHSLSILSQVGNLSRADLNQHGQTETAKQVKHRMGSKNGKYDFHHESSLASLRTTHLPSSSTSDVNTGSVRTKKPQPDSIAVPTCIHRDVLADAPDGTADRLSLVWLDPDVYQRALNIDMEVKLKNLIDYVRLFERVDACERYIKQIGKLNGQIHARQERLLVIISTSLAMTIIPHLHELEQVKYIYIFGKTKSITKGHQQWLRKYVKVRIQPISETTDGTRLCLGQRSVHIFAKPDRSNRSRSTAELRATLRGINCRICHYLIF